MLGAMDQSGNSRRYESDPDEEQRRKAAHKKVLEGKGVYEYEIDGIKVFARSYKNAVKKVDRKKKLLNGNA